MHFAIKLQKTWVATTFQIYFTNIEYVEKKESSRRRVERKKRIFYYCTFIIKN